MDINDVEQEYMTSKENLFWKGKKREKEGKKRLGFL